MSKDLELNWLDARNWCRQRCMDTVSLETAAESYHMKSVIQRSQPIWPISDCRFLFRRISWHNLQKPRFQFRFSFACEQLASLTSGLQGGSVISKGATGPTCSLCSSTGGFGPGRGWDCRQQTAKKRLRHGAALVGLARDSQTTGELF